MNFEPPPTEPSSVVSSSVVSSPGVSSSGGEPPSVRELKDRARHRLLWTRRRVAPLVLAAAQAAQPKPAPDGQKAALALLDRVSSRSQRILRDAIAYDQGTRVSMYWGPFERKHDALYFLGELAGCA